MSLERRTGWNSRTFTFGNVNKTWVNKQFSSKWVEARLLPRGLTNLPHDVDNRLRENDPDVHLVARLQNERFGSPLLLLLLDVTRLLGLLALVGQPGTAISGRLDVLVF
jgi:hypothetical protein